ncbi:phage integrase SAM-like domain-containing protein [Bremerella cremea]|uniref:phage integrase SAM-like domain-containing protein n=1 Tax=Bremerella cremea TaxID=1031537 RepID=UPI0031EF6AD5
MANREQIRSDLTTLYELSQAYLDWCEANRKPNTYERHRYFLKSFVEHIGKRLRPSQLRVHHVRKWHEGLGVGTTTQNDAVGIVQRMLNWGVEQEYLDRNPIAGMKKPRRKRRDVFYTPEQMRAIDK